MVNPNAAAPAVVPVPVLGPVLTPTPRFMTDAGSSGVLKTISRLFPFVGEGVLGDFVGLADRRAAACIRSLIEE